jgi:hypothetical protein
MNPVPQDRYTTEEDCRHCFATLTDKRLDSLKLFARHRLTIVVIASITIIHASAACHSTGIRPYHRTTTVHSTTTTTLTLGAGLRREDSPPVDAVTDFNFFSSAPLQMVSSESVRLSNQRGDRIKDFVAIFVGGTGGIGESTALELFKRTVRPRIYIVGR